MWDTGSRNRKFPAGIRVLGNKDPARWRYHFLRHAPSYWIPIRRGQAPGFTRRQLHLLVRRQLRSAGYAYEARASRGCTFAPLTRSHVTINSIADARNGQLPDAIANPEVSVTPDAPAPMGVVSYRRSVVRSGTRRGLRRSESRRQGLAYSPTITNSVPRTSCSSPIRAKSPTTF